jgi:hypothetical protein
VEGAPALISNHGRALIEIARRPDSRISEIATALGLTERAAQGLVSDLVRAGYLERIRFGRRNRYLVRGDRPVDQPEIVGPPVADLVNAFAGAMPDASLTTCRAVVVACTDFRIQGWLRSLLADQRLLDRAETLLCRGGGATLTGSEAPALYATLEELVAARAPERLLLIAHHPCAVPGVKAARGDALEAYRSIRRRQRRVVAECRRRVGLEPELWLVDPGRFSGVCIDMPARLVRRDLRPAG